MPEAGKAVIKYLFEEVGFNRIAAEHDKENPKSGFVEYAVAEIVSRYYTYVRGMQIFV